MDNEPKRCEFCTGTREVKNRLTPSGVYRWLCKWCWDNMEK